MFIRPGHDFGRQQFMIFSQIYPRMAIFLPTASSANECGNKFRCSRTALPTSPLHHARNAQLFKVYPNSEHAMMQAAL